MDNRILTPLHVQLLSLVAKERTGREIAALYEERFGRPISFGTLYTAFRRMRDDGLVTARNGRTSRGEDQRLRYFKIAGPGVAVLNRSVDEYTAATRAARGALRTLT